MFIHTIYRKSLWKVFCHVRAFKEMSHQFPYRIKSILPFLFKNLKNDFLPHWNGKFDENNLNQSSDKKF